MLITQWIATVQGDHVTVDFTVHHVGKSTALNPHMFYAGRTYMLLPVPPGEVRMVRGLPSEIIDGEGRPVT